MCVFHVGFVFSSLQDSNLLLVQADILNVNSFTCNLSEIRAMMAETLRVNTLEVGTLKDLLFLDTCMHAILHDVEKDCFKNQLLNIAC